MKSGLDWGHWTYASETWFQKRLVAIRDGKAGLRSATLWRANSLTFQSATPRLVKKNLQDAQDWLERSL
jgi:hypothetical protein